MEKKIRIDFERVHYKHKNVLSIFYKNKIVFYFLQASDGLFNEKSIIPDVSALTFNFSDFGIIIALPGDSI